VEAALLGPHGSAEGVEDAHIPVLVLEILLVIIKAVVEDQIARRKKKR
jgi:hypothetical protein